MRKLSFKILNLIVAVILCGYSSFSQQIVKPAEAIELALKHNYGIQIANNNIEIAENNKHVLNSGYLPTLTGLAGGSIDKQNTEGQLADGASHNNSITNSLL